MKMVITQIEDDQAYFVNDHSKSEVLGHSDCATFNPYFDLCPGVVVLKILLQN